MLKKFTKYTHRRHKSSNSIKLNKLNMLHFYLVSAYSVCWITFIHVFTLRVLHLLTSD